MENVPKITAELEAMGIKYSGKESDNNKAVIVVNEADAEAFKKIEKSINIIGNTAFKDIADKNYFEFPNSIAEKINAELTAQGVSFSGRVNKTKTTFTVGAADVEAFKAIEKEVTGQELTAAAPSVAENLPEPPPPLPEVPPMFETTPPPPLSETPPPFPEQLPLESPSTVTPETSVLSDKHEKTETPEKPAKTAKAKTPKPKKEKAEKSEKPKRSITKRIAEGKTADKKDEKTEQTKEKSKGKSQEELGG